MTAILELRDVKKTIGKTAALNGVSIEIDEPGFYGMMGPNGAGKSTLLKIILGLIRPDYGTVSIMGKCVQFGYGGQHASGIVETPEFPSYLRISNIARFIGLMRGLSDSEIDENLRSLCITANLCDLLDRRYGTLSQGMKQRFAILSAFIGYPKVVVLDEPLNGVDAYNANLILDFLRKAKDMGMVVLSTFHDPDQFRDLCDRIFILIDGKIESDATQYRNRRIFKIRSELVSDRVEGCRNIGNYLVFGLDENSIDALELARRLHLGIDRIETGDGLREYYHLILQDHYRNDRNYK
ncbi:ABC transporter ATP-binding protein [Thermoplasma sp. Kam2015]|uniref:ABC transporter ATP-binding protein n=1 Tax=Thermoplasma sp. Kam2015 TaxID=2094122 RepID=UPI001379C863|nr:ABC transporter ATP-binding protein [Thermoplasma sp. Kam2015]